MTVKSLSIVTKYVSLSTYILFLLIHFSSVNAQPVVQWQKAYGGGNAIASDNSIAQTTDGGYVVAGSSSKNGQTQASLKKLDAAGNILWAKTYGGSFEDKFNSVQQTTDGGYIALGVSYSSDGDVSGHHGTNTSTDYWVVKTDAAGNIAWQHSYGGASNETAAKIIKTNDGGYLLSGSALSTDGDVSGHYPGAFFFDGWLVKIDNAGNIQWQKCLGGSNNDGISSVKQTADGGYILAGQTNSVDGNVTGFHGGYADYWVIKINNTGSVLWQKCLGGVGADYAWDINLANDGGYIVSGTATSNDGDVTGHHGATSSYDAWIVKVDSTGAIQWQKSFGGANDEDGKAVQQTTDGGYVFGGSTFSNDGDVTGLHGVQPDAWVVKLDATGAISWQKSLGGTGAEYAYDLLQTADGGYVYAGKSTTLFGSFASQYWIQKLDNTGTVAWQKNSGGSVGDEHGYAVQQTTDGGYIMVGDANSDDGDVSGIKGLRDIWVLKTNATGAIQWQKTLGGAGNDAVAAVQQTTDGGYIIAGETFSTDGDGTGNHGANDGFVIKLDALGNTQWSKTYGGTLSEYFSAIQQSTDGGYIMAGITTSNNGDVSGFKGGVDYWVVKINSTGAIQWQNCLGGAANDYAYSIKTTTGGGYIVAGDVSSNDGDVTGNHSTNYDYWIVKLDATGNITWQKTYGGTAADDCHFIQQTADGGYIATGFSKSVDGDVTGNHGGWDYWVIKTDASGTLQWQKSLGGSSNDYSYSVKPTADGGYIVGGDVLSNDGDVSGNHGSYDYWIVKLDGTGTIQWKKIMGGSAEDDVSDVQQTSDGGYIVIGQTKSNDGDVSGNHGGSANAGGIDFWVVKLSSGAPLPVTLLSFTAQKQQNDVMTNWETSNQLNFSHYEIERSLDAIHFEKAGTVQPVNGSGVLNYQFKDLNAVNIYKNNGRLFYRLKMIDLDRTTTYSKTARVDFDKKHTIEVYPNPVHDYVSIRTDIGSTNKALIVTITDQAGRITGTSIFAASSGSVKTISTQKLAAGIYNVVVTDTDGLIHLKKQIVKQ